MSKKLETRFQEEVRRRSQTKKKDAGRNDKTLWLLAGGAIAFIRLMHQCNSTPVDPPSSKIASPQPASPQPASPTPVSPKPQRTPLALPQTGVLKPYIPATNEYSSGRLRFFLRTPFPEEKSALPQTCSSGKSPGVTAAKNHYYVQLLDWESNQVITTALIQAGEMVEMVVPFGTFKLRYAVGTAWYGETEMFGSEEMYEMTEASSSRSAKFEFSLEKPGSDIGTYCFGGNLGKKRIKRESPGL
jgi:hypothetical protein